MNTLTPSAINSWVGEEVKVLGVEGTVRTTIGDNMVAFTGSIFGFDDTAGTCIVVPWLGSAQRQGDRVRSFPAPPLKSVHHADPAARNQVDDRDRSPARLLWADRMAAAGSVRPRLVLL